jgi:mRNA interferase MazF
MVSSSVGDVVPIPFPFADLSKSRRQPVLVVADVGREDYVLCRITSRPQDDSHALSLSEVHFSGGWLRRENFIRVGKLFTANGFLVLGIAGHLTDSMLAEVISLLVGMFSSALVDDTF